MATEYDFDALALTCTYLCERDDNEDGSKWKHDEWSCVLRTERTDTIHRFHYKTGTGLRKKPANGPFAAMPARPDNKSIMYSLLDDVSCVEGHTFGGFCEELGYDSDSRRALAIYEECQKTKDALDKLFSSAELQAMRDALEDY